MPDIDLGDYEIDEDSNGDLVIKDPNDNNVFRWDSANAKWTFDSNPVEGISSLSTGDLDITGELLVDAHKTTNQSYSTANGFVTVTWDTENKDVTDDFDLSNDQWSPPEDGWYQVVCSITINSYSDQDNVALRVRNTTDDSTVANRKDQMSGSFDCSVQVICEKQFLASKTYEIQFQNADSDDDIVNGESVSYLNISRSEEA